MLAVSPASVDFRSGRQLLISGFPGRTVDKLEAGYCSCAKSCAGMTGQPLAIPIQK